MTPNSNKPQNENGRHSIEIYDLRERHLHHRKTIADPMLISPNDIVAVGPEQFYATNDHRYAGGMGQVLENYLQLKLSNVVYYNGSSFGEAVSGIGYANGINVSADGKTLYLCATIEGVLHVYQRDVTSGKLKFHQKLKLGTGLDNLEIDSNGGLWIAAHPQLLTFVQHAQNSAKISPSQILQLAI
jgi:arylesterase/paraoxonase